METWLPIVNTALIALSGVSVLIGYIAVRLRRIQIHYRAMLVGTVFAALFLIVYVLRYFLLGTKLYTGEGWVRLVYFAVLISHTILAIILGPLVLVTLGRAFRRQFSRHRAIARVTLPVWLYVAVTGWIIFAMLYGL
jgi:putative membrane protein